MAKNLCKVQVSKLDPDGRRIVCGYESFDGSRLDFGKAIKYLNDFASKGISPALCAKGIMHWYGWRGEKLDRKLAIELIKRASDQGYDQASVLLTNILTDNPEYAHKVEGNAVAANPNATTLNNVQNQNQNQNQSDEVESILERIKNGDSFALKQLYSLAVDGVSNAQFELGYMYQLGQVFEENVEKAEFWYVRAAKQGNELAQINLRSIDVKYRNWSMWD